MILLMQVSRPILICRVNTAFTEYLHHFWTQVFRYQKDGEYTIDNNLAERFIRPLTRERKNSLFFGSHKMARVSAAYHSVISTCKFHGISILEYLKKFFKEIVAGNRDYGKLMPSTIGIAANKSCANEYKVKLA